MSAATTFPAISTVAASTDTDVSTELVDASDIEAISTTDGEVTTNTNVLLPKKSARDATETHSVITKVSSHTTKNKLLKLVTGYIKGPGTKSYGQGNRFSGTVAVNDGKLTVSVGFSVTTTSSCSFPVPSGREGAIGFYADVTATRYLIKEYRNLNNALVRSCYTTQSSLSNKYYALHLK
ncbi:hypothetical protein ACFQ4L_06925 [Lapidilactobacillus mulanensis]|uniref:Uncharacterized protein n=1 Tax=Lapidilactobacillus mulanensis TaxID=2485999 RepID=A0ABW4DRK9_9LACO|nr:hypothetical protein [Lapidilactobacillus mulanensis]